MLHDKSAKGATSQFSTFTAKPTESLAGNVQGIAGKTAGVRPREPKFPTTRERLAPLKRQNGNFHENKFNFKA
jgi:hypothetical protein